MDKETPRFLSSSLPRSMPGSRALLHRNETDQIIKVAIAVHKALGPGFLESVYEEAFALELDTREVPYERQRLVRVRYGGATVGVHKLDFVVMGKIVVELRAVKEVSDVHIAVVLAYLKASQLVVGLILNFAEPVLRVRRVGREGIFYGESGKKGSGADFSTEPAMRRLPHVPKP